MKKLRKNQGIGLMTLIFIIVLLIAIVCLVLYIYDLRKQLDDSTEQTGQNEISNENENSTNENIGDFFVIYNGVEISKNPGVQLLNYIDKNNKDNPKYKSNYYLYKYRKILWRVY